MSDFESKFSFDDADRSRHYHRFLKKMLSVVRQGKVGGFPGSFSFLVVSSPSHLHNDITVSLISEQISPQLTKQKTKNIKCLNQLALLFLNILSNWEKKSFTP